MMNRRYFHAVLSLSAAFFLSVPAAFFSEETPASVNAETVAAPYEEGIDDNSIPVEMGEEADDTVAEAYKEDADALELAGELGGSSEAGAQSAGAFDASSPDFAGQAASHDADEELGGERTSDDAYGSDGASADGTSAFDDADSADAVEFDAVSGAQEEKKPSADEYGDNLSLVEITIPDAKRPKKPDAKKLEEAQKRDEDNSEFKEKSETLSYGTPSEISGAVDKIVSEEDPRYAEILYDLFQETGSDDVRCRILDYFAKQEDPCLEDYAVEVLSDPYDLSNTLVSKCMSYVSAVQCKEAAPALVKLLDDEESDYFNAALSALGKTGGVKEAKYLANYLQRDDLETPIRQSLMRTLGQMNAIETWAQVADIARDEDENSFVRQYAAEAIGNMKKEESIPILVGLYARANPNLREYCIKGLMNFPDSDEAVSTILQGVKDDHVKVRLQSIKAVKEMKLKSAVDSLIYRAKNDAENAVKKECYPVIAELNTKNGNDFLVERITDAKVADSAKSMAAEAMLMFESPGTKEIAELAKAVAVDDRRKPLRKSLGKILSKYDRKEFGEVCKLYVQSKDTDTVTLGLDMFRTGRYSEAEADVRAIAEAKTGNIPNRKRAQRLLGIEETDETKK